MESGAIALHLAEKFGGTEHALFGKPEQRAQLLQWLFYAPATLYYAMIPGFESDDEMLMAKAKAKAKLTTTILPYIATQLGSKPFMLGDDYTLADAFLGYELYGLYHLQWMNDFPTLKEYVARLISRESWKQVYPQGESAQQ